MEKIKVLFWRRPHSNPQRKTSVMCRITIDGERTEFSTNVRATNTTWSQERQRLKGNNDESYIANKAISLISNQIDDICFDLRRSGIPITGMAIKYELGGGIKRDNKYTILNLYNEDIANYTEDTTLRNKKSLVNTMEKFLIETFSSKDFFVYRVDHSFLKKFETWGLKTMGWKVNSLHVHLDILRKVCDRCFNEGVIKRHPFSNYKLKREKSKDRYIPPQNVEKIFSSVRDFEPFYDPIKSYVKHTPENIELTRKIFIFLCFVGAAYTDGKKLTKANIVEDVDHGLSLSFKRTKTKVEAFVPLLDYPKELLEELKNHPKSIKGQKLLPMESLDVYNKRLKVLQHMLGIENDLTSHVARHIAATFYLNAGVSIHIIAKALGLSEEELKKTYAKLHKETISIEFNLLNNKLKLQHTK